MNPLMVQSYLDKYTGTGMGQQSSTRCTARSSCRVPTCASAFHVAYVGPSNFRPSKALSVDALPNRHCPVSATADPRRSLFF